MHDLISGNGTMHSYSTLIISTVIRSKWEGHAKDHIKIPILLLSQQVVPESSLCITNRDTPTSVRTYDDSCRETDGYYPDFITTPRDAVFILLGTFVLWFIQGFVFAGGFFFGNILGRSIPDNVNANFLMIGWVDEVWMRNKLRDILTFMFCNTNKLCTRFG